LFSSAQVLLSVSAAVLHFVLVSGFWSTYSWQFQVP